ncbi:hypothetical protein BCF33_1590 [Hasllibacter halocynthiae]|uniref:Protease inhibitor Inh n=1 Tax=Hasllibacter halocynthiae TaxID=595589 RepID=A0A2T0X1B0_9RHOB|nr:hypothetical protein [Hasllibacter halocynthiae]PRY92736.1 hypothetical protein BCF33_1590 [Hasllibacter halocynthiae]
MRALLALALLALPAAARQPCEADAGAGDPCSRVLACIGTEGEWFDGRALGWNEGTLEGALGSGAACTGRWAYVSGGAAAAEILCEDGMEGTVSYFAQDGPTGTGLGYGATSDGRRIEAWTGENVLGFLAGKDGVPRLPCAPAIDLVG